MNHVDRMELNAKQLALLEGNIFNKRVGDFLYRHHEANPKWYAFFDQLGNSVFYGGDTTDVIIHIKGTSRKELGNRLVDYMGELVGRHNESLHGEGAKKFHAVTITLPVGVLRNSSELEVTIHTGSGGCYDQDEIACEVMAALSDIPVYKALAPQFSYHNFVRLDQVDDKGWINYLFEEQGVHVSFSCLNDQTCVMVRKFLTEPRADLTKFKDIMYELFSEWVKAFAEKDMVREYGRRLYDYEGHSLSGDQKHILVLIEPAMADDPLSFSVSIPYFSHVDFGRIVFAKDVMERLSNAFPVKKEEGLEVA